jgi:hypothetical protein
MPIGLLALGAGGFQLVRENGANRSWFAVDSSPSV